MFFPLRFAGWKTRMLWNAARSRPELLALGGAAALLALSGGVALAWRLGSGFVEVYEAGPDALERALTLGALALYLALTFMALANVITRFFGDARLAEREHLMGPLSPGALFVTEVVDAYRLPLILLVGLGLAPLTVGGIRAGVPSVAIASTWAAALPVFIQPTLGVMAAAILVVRAVPRSLQGRQGLLFTAMLASCLLLFTGLGTIRGLLQGAALGALSLLPTHQLGLIAAWQRGSHDVLWTAPLISWATTALLWALCQAIYGRWFLEDLDRFRLTAVDEAAGGGGRGWLAALLGRALGRAVAAVVIKDLRSTRRDTAQQVAFTLMAALVSALVLGDLSAGSRYSPLFLPIFFVYAVFLVSTQALSTFSAEGGMLDNLARLPLTAGQLLKAKVVSHLLLFLGVIGAAVLLMALAPLGIPLYLRIPLALGVGLALVPGAVALSILTVTLGAIFPKPGEGGAQKEISVFAMGLFLQLGALMVISLGASGAAVALGPAFVLVPLVTLGIWLGVLALLWRFATQAVGRALGG